MARVVLRLRPTGTFAGMDPAAVAGHAGRLRRWRAEVIDSRASDAPYLTVLAFTADIDDEAAAELCEVFRDLPEFHVYLLRSIAEEQPLGDATAETLRAAARAVPP